MGIQNFHSFVKKHAPHVYRQIHLSEYAGKRVAVDISGLIYKYKILNKGKWLDSFVYLVLSLRRNRVHPIFVFDGQAPAEKDEEKTRRSAQRKVLSEKVFSLRESLDQYYSSGEVNSVLVETMKKIGEDGPPSLLSSSGSRGINTSLLEKKFDKMESQIVHWGEGEMEDLHTLFDLMGVQYLTAPTEAESMCASMALDGKVEAVVSNDSDVCAYGVQKFLYEINGMNETCIEIDYNELLTGLNLTSDQFLDFCIMCGCDYNDNIPGIGPMNSYKLIKQFNRIENLPEKYDVSILRYARSREIFKTRFSYEDEVLSQQPSPSALIELTNFLKLRNSRVKYEMIMKAFEPVEIIFEE